MPVVDNLVAGDDHVSLAHSYMLGLNRDSLAINWATDSVAEHDVPLAFYFFVFGDQDAIFVTAGNPLQALHVLNVLLVHGGVPEDDAHVITFGLTESKNESASKVSPHVVRLDISEQDVRIDGQGNS